MEANVLTTVLLPVVIGIIMFGLGLHLRTDDFRRIASMPKPVIVGLATQLLVLPPIAFVLCLLFALPAEIAVGFMLLVASPGGATANVFSHLARGDVALNITLTALNSLVILLTLPLIVSWSMAYFMAEHAAIPAPTRKVIEVAVIILLPVALGMLVRARASTLADRLEAWVKPLSLITLVVLIVITVVREWALIVKHIGTLGLACLALSLLSLSIGYGVARLLNLHARQSIAIAFEIGIHNTTLAIFIALSVLKLPALSVPAAIYSLVMYGTAGLAAWWFLRRAPSLS